MSNYVVGSDRSGNNDHECIETICQVLRDAGHTAENIGITPNLETNLKTKGKGNIGVFMVNGICIGTIHSVRKMVEAGGIDFVYFAMPQTINPGNEWLSCESLKTKKCPIAHDDNFTKEPDRSALHNKYTVAEYCAEHSQYIAYACGSDCKEVAEAILNGGSGDGSGATGTSSDSEDSEPTPMSYLDMIKDLISVWDGDVECKVRQNKMFINKVPEPKPQLWIVESNNIVSGQAKVTDYNSDTINSLDVTYGDGHKINIKDEYLYNRFGEVSAEIEAVKTVTDYSGDPSSDGSASGGTDSSSSTDSELYTKLASVLQKYFVSNDWNSFINRVRFAKDYNEVSSIITGHKRKSGVNTRYTQIIRELCDLKGINT